MSLRQLTAKIWHSPTFTTWGNQLTQSLRLLLVTPLLLTHFNQTEIAAWYLFATLNVFGSIVAKRLEISFSRMISFAMSGAVNLSPITDAKAIRGSGEPNWQSVRRAIGTLGLIQLLVALANTIIASGMGYFALTSLLSDYTGLESIWLAFVVMQISNLISIACNRYGVVLQGMNHIAIVNRWSILFSLLSVALGVVALDLGVSMFVLALVMQTVPLLGIIRNRLLLKYYTCGKLSNIDKLDWDSEIARWAWGPAWRGFIGQFTNVGLVQLSGVIFARFGEPGAVATYLFTLRLIDLVTNFAQSTLFSKIPLCAKMLASGELERLAILFYYRANLAGWLTVAAFILIGLCGQWVFTLIGANIHFASPEVWFIFAVLAAIKGYMNFIAMPVGFGNRVIFHWHYLASAMVALALLPFMLPRFGIIGIVVSLWLPTILILNVAPVIAAAKVLHVRPTLVFRRTVFPIAAFVCFSVIYMVIVPEYK